MPDAIKRTIRTIAQFIAAGGLTAIVAEISDRVGDDPLVLAIIQAVNLLIVTLAQNAIEDATGRALLKEPRGRHAA